jgi:hypothetical protein
VLFIREIDPDKSERILAILFDKEVSRTLCFLLFHFQVRSRTQQQTQACTDSPTSPKDFTDLVCCKVVFPTIQCNCSACNVSQTTGIQKKKPRVVVGLAGPRTRATCVARSIANRAAIHNNMTIGPFLFIYY